MSGCTRVIRQAIRPKNSGGSINRRHALWGPLPVAILPGLRKFVPQSEHACGASMAANGLIDTGAMLALLDRSDQWHRSCVETFAQLRLPFLTSEAVLTELFHMVGESAHETEAAWKLVRSGAIALAVIEHSELPAIHALMSRYADRPMDFADATLVHLAKRERLTTVFTVDHADFENYRIDGRRRFRILPSLHP
jgi:predicted nucleic acid-binding protein